MEAGADWNWECREFLSVLGAPDLWRSEMESRWEPRWNRDGAAGIHRCGVRIYTIYLNNYKLKEDEKMHAVETQRIRYKYQRKVVNTKKNNCSWHLLYLNCNFPASFCLHWAIDFYPQLCHYSSGLYWINFAWVQNGNWCCTCPPRGLKIVSIYI